ncbi:hypothetical protein E2C01_077141 [Portunus trituberculatus]|uniref:Uncharacterized protein n=1 Tax=Portunus trituberculatus TaxID=210409 RepID=A0A5B7IF21_PORTR|nr:hypothetical protein [Portunus trituberculatus]
MTTITSPACIPQPERGRHLTMGSVIHP